MRASSQRNNGAPYAIPFSWFDSIVGEDGEKLAFEDTLSTDLLPDSQSANVSETFTSSLWQHVLPGLERTCIVLRTQEYSHSEIAWILGMKTDEVSRVLYKVKNRLIKLGITKTLVVR